LVRNIGDNVSLTKPFAELSGYVAFKIPLPDVRPLVVLLFAFAEAELHFYAALFEIKRKRNKGIAFFFYLSVDSFDLVTVEEEFLFSVRVMVKNRGEGIFRYLERANPDFPLNDFGPGVGKGNLPVPEGLYLRSKEFNATFVGFVNSIIMPGLAVNSDGFCTFAHWRFPFKAMTGLNDTKGEQKEGGREPLISLPTDPAVLTQEPPLTERSGEPNSSAAAQGTERKLSGA
jgi:hypothetical protein